MKTIIITILFLISNFTFSQNLELIHYKPNEDFNYILGNIWWDKIFTKELSGSRVTILEQSDPLNTPEGLFEGYGGVISNLIISIRNTGEFAYSNLYFIKGLIAPSILEVEEVSNYERIKIVIEFQDKQFKTQTQTFLIPSLH